MQLNPQGIKIVSGFQVKHCEFWNATHYVSVPSKVDTTGSLAI